MVEQTLRSTLLKRPTATVRDREVLMKMPGNMGMLLLAIYLIWVGVMGLFSPDVGKLVILGPILALSSGILLLMKK